MIRVPAMLTTRLGTALVLVSLAGCGASWKAPLETRSDGRSGHHHAPRNSAPPSINGRTYRVRRGDTLYSIAWRSGKDFRSLAQWNRIRAPYTIYPGQVIRLVSPVRQAQAPAKAPPIAAQRPAQPSRVPPSAHTRSTPRPPPKPARQVGALHWQWPVNGPLISSYSQRDATRQGIKIGGKPGQAVRAAEAGRVVYSGSGLIGYGQLIIIKHNDKYLSAYGHNAKLLVKEGAQVAKGARIADMGRSNDGRAMLHFEIRRDGRPIDPAALLPRR